MSAVRITAHAGPVFSKPDVVFTPIRRGGRMPGYLRSVFIRVEKKV